MRFLNLINAMAVKLTFSFIWYQKHSVCNWKFIQNRKYGNEKKNFGVLNCFGAISWNSSYLAACVTQINLGWKLDISFNVISRFGFHANHKRLSQLILMNVTLKFMENTKQYDQVNSNTNKIVGSIKRNKVKNTIENQNIHTLTHCQLPFIRLTRPFLAVKICVCQILVENVPKIRQTSMKKVYAHETPQISANKCYF